MHYAGRLARKMKEYDSKINANEDDKRNEDLLIRIIKTKKPKMGALQWKTVQLNTRGTFSVLCKIQHQQITAN